jgi:hypothetical protein
MTYFRTGSPYYHRRAAVSRSCSGWEGVVPAGYGRQAWSEFRIQKSEDARLRLLTCLLNSDAEGKAG